MNLSHEDVLEILALLDASGFDELRLETDRYKLHLRRTGAPASAPPMPASDAAAPAAPRTVGPAAASAGTPNVPVTPAAPTAPPAATAGAEGTIDITSPMVGTFYGSPKPGDPPFIAPGSEVEADTVIGIVEVMKLMNSISAGKRGTVVEIVAVDGELVQYGSVLARIVPRP